MSDSEARRAQSPIDLGVAVSCEQPELAIDYLPSTTHGHDKGSTLDVSVAGGSAITYRGTRYELKSYHFHTPSEHVIDGEHAAVEIHFVHQDPDGGYAVLGVLADESDMSKAATSLEGAVAIEDLLPDAETHYSYEGSLTTPPFTEGVQWIVLTERVALHPDWVAAFRHRYGENNRRLQALNDRTVCLG